MLITYTAKLLEKKEIAPEIFLFTFSRPEDQTWTYKAGQYMIFHIPQSDNHPVRRLYSIASPPSRMTDLQFVIEMVPNGIGSKYLDALPIGESVTLQGPAGIFTIKENDRHKIFLATGTGVAPMHSMIHTLLERGTTARLFLFWGMKMCADMYYLEEFKHMAEQHLNFAPQLCFSRETSIEAVKEEAKKYASLGRVTNGFEALIESLQPLNPQPLPDLLNSFDYYLCGSHPVVESLRQYLAGKGITKENIIFEKFTAGA